MRKSLLISIVVFMCLNTGAVRAHTTEKLYQYCKSFADNGFKGQNIEHAGCFSYVLGITDVARSACDLYSLSSNGKPLLSIAAKAEQQDLHAVIQAFINQAANNPQTWRYDASLYVVFAAQKVAPCE